MKMIQSPTALQTTAVLGWAMGLGWVSLLVFTVRNPDPLWGAWWQLRPLLVTPLVAGLGAGLSYVIFEQGQGGHARKVGFTALAIAVFLFSLWVGTILGLQGTLWN